METVELSDETRKGLSVPARAFDRLAVPAPELKPHKPTIEFHGPIAKHDQACAVCHNRPAVYQFDGALFQPCWICQEFGYVLTKERTLWEKCLDFLCGIKPHKRNKKN